MFDFYGFPGLRECRAISPAHRSVAALEERFAREYAGRRFIPFFSLHEFEAWIFSSPEVASAYLGSPAAEEYMQAVLDECGAPELINHGRAMHPKARIHSIYPRYREVSDGPIVLKTIGIERIRERCPHFHAWVTRLEGLAA